MTLRTKLKSAASTTALLLVMCLHTSEASASTGGDTIQIQKNSLNRSHRISLHTDANQKVVFFSVKGEEGKVYQLYMFDVEGKMVRQAETRNKETIIIKGIQKGVYLFDVFTDDVRIGNGRIAVK